MDRFPMFSIIIPTYNSIDTISNCIGSILAQTIEDYEIIVIDDGSTDNTLEILASLAKDHSELKYYSIKNSGPGQARNVGISKASGHFYIFIDSDDYVLSDFLETYYKILTVQDYDLIATSYKTKVYDNEVVVSESDTKYPTTKLDNQSEFLDELYPLMDKQMMYVVWNKVYKSDLIKKYNVHFPDYRSCEDRIFNLRYFEHIESALILEDINFEYSFDGKNSLTNKFFTNKFDTFLHWYDELTNFVNKDFQGYDSLFVKGVMSCLVSLHSDSCPYNFKEKRSYISNVLGHNKVIRASRNASKETLMKRIIANLLYSKSTTLNYMASHLMFRVSQLSPSIIEKFKALY